MRIFAMTSIGRKKTFGFISTRLHPKRPIFARIFPVFSNIQNFPKRRSGSAKIIEKLKNGFFITEYSQGFGNQIYGGLMGNRSKFGRCVGSKSWRDLRKQQYDSFSSEERLFDRFCIGLCIMAALYFGGHLALAIWKGAS